MLFHRLGICDSARLHVTFGGSGGIMTTAGPGLPYPCSPQAKTRDMLASTVYQRNMNSELECYYFFKL